MTTIRRIVTSQVDGNDANTNNDSEIRPFGETAIYLDTNGPVDKPVLAMHDGVRTHIRSKVLGPGVLYGSNADAGDGSNADTIKLIPDALLYDQGSNQYIVVDPTGGEPGHIHLRAGGTQDSSNADLYLGGELTCVRVSDTSDTVTIRTTNIGDPNITLDWSFQPDGNLYFPGIGNNRIGESEPGLVVSSDNSVVLQSNNNIVNTYEVEFVGYISNGFGDSPGATLTVNEIVAGTITDGMTIYGAGLPPEGWTLTFGGVMEPQGSGGIGNYLLSGANFLIPSQSFNNDVLAEGSHSWFFSSDGTTYLPSNSFSNISYLSSPLNNTDVKLSLGGGDGVDIVADVFSGSLTRWSFGTNGNLTFPDATEQTTAWAGGRVVYAPSFSTGADGDRAGDIAFSNDYIYYCTANYDSTTNIWKRVALTNETW